MEEKEKARAYDEALERAKLAIKECGDNKGRISMIESIFPALKESEDERIRKGLIKAVSGTMKGYTLFDTDVTREEALAWLEKQDSQKATTVWHDVSEVPDEMQELLVELESPDATWHNIAFYDAETKAFRHLKQPINNVTRWAYVSDILTQSVTKTSDKEKGSEQIPANPEKNIKYEPKFKAGDKLISTKNPHLTYEILGIEDNELGELDYNVIIYPDGKCAVYNKLSCKKVDSWGEFVEENPAWSEEDERLCQCLIKDQEEALDKVRNNRYGHTEIILDLKEMYIERIKWLESLKKRFVG